MLFCIIFCWSLNYKSKIKGTFILSLNYGKCMLICFCFWSIVPVNMWRFFKLGTQFLAWHLEFCWEIFRLGSAYCRVFFGPKMVKIHLIQSLIGCSRSNPIQTCFFCKLIIYLDIYRIWKNLEYCHQRLIW